jgi:predicted nucleotidyltransferase
MALELLTVTERDCLERYLATLREELDEQLLGVWIFGSVARGERWPHGMPIRSDLDMLVVVAERLPEERADELVDATFPLFLEAGRQIGPQFRTPAQLERESAFLENVRRDGRRAVALALRRAAPAVMHLVCR